MANKVTVEINQQQAQLLDRLIDEDGLGSEYGDVIRSGFLRFCEEHPDLVAGASPEDENDE